MDNFMIAFVLLLLFILASRVINERANKKLDPSKKAELIDLFSKGRIYTFGILILIISLFFVTIRFELIDSTMAYAVYLISILVFVVISGISAYRKLKMNAFPDSYIRSYLITTSLRILGLVIFFALVGF